MHMVWNPEQHYQTSRIADDYDRARFSSLAGRIFNWWEQRTIVKCFADMSAEGSIVDAPCGTGRLAGALLAAGYRVHGLDISDAMLRVARRRLQKYGPQFTCAVADARHLAANPPTHEGALCARVLMHFPLEQQVEFLAGVATLSRSTVVISHSLDSPYQRFRRRIKRFLGHQPSVNYPLTNEAIKQLLARAGLRERKRYRLCRPLSEALYIVAEKI